MSKIFFNSSLPRAGSTLLQNILGQNPDFYVTPTSGVVELLYAARVNYTEDQSFLAQDPSIMKKGWISFCRHGLEGFFKGITDKKYVVDKSRSWAYYYNWIDTFYPKPKVICMVRDLRCIYTSMERNFRKHPEKNSSITDWVELKGTTTLKRINIWAESPPIGQSMDRLKEIIIQGIYKNIHFIRFEDLTSNPQNELNKIYDYLEVDRFNHDFKNIKQITEENDKIYGIFGDHKIRQVVEPVPAQYNKILGEELSQNIVNTYPWFYKYFNY